MRNSWCWSRALNLSVLVSAFIHYATISVSYSCSILLMFTLAKIGLKITFARTNELIDQIKAISQKEREGSESMLRCTMVAHLEGSISRTYDYM